MMKNILVTTTVLLAGLFWAVSAQAQTPLTGVWEVEEITRDGGRFQGTSTEPGLIFFGDEYYSTMHVNAPRPLEPEDTPRRELSYEQMLAAYDPFTANAGTYGVEGSTVTMRPSVALSARFMSGGEVTSEYRMEGNKLILTFTNDDGDTTISTLVRIE
jgi:hypothetical protein